VTVLQGGEELKVVGEDRIEPHPGGVRNALARIGYKLPEALADLIDNSIDARAKRVLVRFFCTDDSIRRVAIVDDGQGMTAEELRNGMQFGAAIDHSRKDLGKFGMGLKSASLSHCRELSVLTRKNGETSARRWTADTIDTDWCCSRLDPDDADKLLDADWGALRIRKSGTVILWDKLEQLHRGAGGGLGQTIKKLFNSLRVPLGMVYHRFLKDGRLALRVDVVKYGDSVPAGELAIDPVDPFAYERSGSKHYPKIFKVQLEKGGTLELETHVWPPRSGQLEYKLGGTAAARQGFYFYRNDRLIQAGGWNKFRQDGEPHLSLARIKVELPASMDSLFMLDVQKSSLNVPQDFDPALRAARSGDASFEDYVTDAQTAYRRKEGAVPENRPITIGRGMASEVRKEANAVLADGKKRQRKVDFKWVRLPPTIFFEIDRTNWALKLNNVYREAAEGSSRRNRDAPIEMIKALLFLLLRDDFKRERLSEDLREKLESCNKMLLKALVSGE
jgi:hypothetical protein